VAEELLELITEELDDELDGIDEDEDEDEDGGALDDELDGREEELLDGVDELLEPPKAGAEHSLTPPATLPPKVASLQTKLPLSTL
jgi:hypothetical protein